MKGKKKYIIIGALIIVGLIAVGSYRFLSNIRQQRQIRQAGGSNIVAAVERGNLEVWVSGTGAVEASLEEEVRTRISGTISEFYMKDNQQVEAGDILAKLEVQDLSLQIQKTQLDIDIQRKELSKLQEEETEALIYSEDSGEIVWNVKEGDKVQQNAILGSINNNSAFEAIGLYNKSQLSSIKVGDKAEIFFPDYFSGIQGKVIDISNVGKTLDNGGVLYEVKVLFEQPGGLMEGVKGQLTIATDNGNYRSIEDVTVQYPEPVSFKAPIAGELTNINVASGKNITKGQLLGKIINVDRQEQISDQIETQKLKLEQLQLDLEDKQRQQQESASNSIVTAPISGVITLPDIIKGIGDDVNQGTVLGTLTGYTKMKVVIPVDELDIAKIKPGQEVNISSVAIEGKEIKGRVSSIATRGVNQSGVSTFDVTIEIDPVEDLLVGMTVTADILVEKRENTLLVPIEAVREQNGRSVVFKLVENNSSEEEPTSQPVPIKVGAYDTSRMEVLDGLEEGDSIIIQGTSGVEASQQNRMIPMGGGNMIPNGNMQRRPN